MTSCNLTLQRPKKKKIKYWIEILVLTFLGTINGAPSENCILDRSAHKSDVNVKVSNERHDASTTDFVIDFNNVLSNINDH